MKYEQPPTIELRLIPILENVEDRHKVECIKVLIESILTQGTINEIRELVNQPGYDDPTP